MHQRLRFLAALLFAAEREGPGGHDLVDIFRVDFFRQAVALRFQAQAVAEHIGGALVGIGDIVPGDLGVGRRDGAGDQGEDGESDRTWKLWLHAGLPCWFLWWCDVVAMGN